MIYKILLSKLKKIANPFKQVAFDDTKFPLEIEQIESAINSNNIFEDENESALQNHIRKISYIVSNYTQQAVTINLEKNSSGWIIEEGSAYLAASIYRGEKYILAEIKGSKKSIETLFGEIESIQRYEKSKKEEIIKWDTLPAVDNWSNMKYITPLVLKGLEKKNLKLYMKV